MTDFVTEERFAGPDRFIDISRPIGPATLCWPGREPPCHEWVKRIANGDHCNSSNWQFNAHTGTHLDAPAHFLEGGKSVDQLDPSVFFGECRVVDIRSREDLHVDDCLASQWQGATRLLIRTLHSSLADCDKYLPHGGLLSTSAASILLAAGLKLIGTDRFSIDDSESKAFLLHHKLLHAGCVILEGLNLANVTPGHYALVAAPLRFIGAEASPVRAFLWDAGHRRTAS